MNKTITINYTSGTTLTSSAIDLLPCGDFMRITNQVANTQEIIPAASIASIIEHGDATRQSGGDAISIDFGSKIQRIRGTIVSNNGGFLTVVDNKKGTKTWIAAHAFDEIMVMFDRSERSGDTTKVTFADNNVISYENAAVKLEGSFICISRECEGLASWFPASAISKIEFLNS
ncbi:hypothetical protein [Brucella tritici]|uniref:Uncharacterized protein n=1 Tax=Brucella tritici TaxID=94626 RepID=A0A6L3YE46_9HYPH|nr:hypothetical protein [Brucella tritici]KAB2680070.1 hypothetical protein F9L08_21980 [Brucella tritici]